MRIARLFRAPSRPEVVVRKAIVIVLASAALVACAPTRYEYMPVATTTTTGAETGGAAAATYANPDSNQGMVRLGSFGVAEVPFGTGGDETKLRAVHLRMIVTNRSGSTWTVDGAEQRIELDDKGTRTAVYAMTVEGGRAPTVDVAAGQSGTLELYFPLPPKLQAEKEIPRFDAVWSVRAGASPVTERTSFERVVVSPPTSKERESPGSYFYDPFNAEGTFPRQTPDSIGYPPSNAPPTRPNPRY
jgi:hypothetical protein